MNRRWTQALALAAITVVLVAGCGKKPPQIPEPMEPEPMQKPEAVEVPPPPSMT